MFTGTKNFNAARKDAFDLYFGASGEDKFESEKRCELVFRRFVCGRLCYNRKIFVVYAAQTLNLRRNKI